MPGETASKPAGLTWKLILTRCADFWSRKFLMARNPSKAPSPIVLDYLPRGISRGAQLPGGISWLALFSAVLAMLAMIAVMFALEMLLLVVMQFFTSNKVEPAAPSVLIGSCAAALVLTWISMWVWRKERQLVAIQLAVAAAPADSSDPECQAGGSALETVRSTPPAAALQQSDDPAAKPRDFPG
jgi:hypothetical protein